MQQVFLIIISILGAVYALFTKQAKMALGYFIIAVSFVFAIPNIVSGIWTDVFGAITMIFFALGVFVMVFKKKSQEQKEEENKIKEPEKN